MLIGRSEKCGVNSGTAKTIDEINLWIEEPRVAA